MHERKKKSGKNKHFVGARIKVYTVVIKRCDKIMTNLNLVNIIFTILFYFLSTHKHNSLFI